MSIKNKRAVAASTRKSPWKRHKLFNSPFPRYRHAAASISSEKSEIFLMGGLKEGAVFGDTWKIVPQESDDGEINTFIAKNIEIINLNNPPARVGHSGVLCGNAFIIFGGDTVDMDFNGFPDNNFYLFNTNNNKYTIPSHILNKPNGRYGHTIGALSLNSSSSRLYLFGGQLEQDVFNDLYFFELNTFKSPKARWDLVEPLHNFKPPPLANHSMSVYKNKIYVFGGVYNNEKVSNDLWCFDALSNKWSQIETTGAVPLPVNEHSSCIVNEKLYIYGGNDFSGIIYNSLHVLDLHTLVWSKLTEEGEINGPGSRCGHTMTYLPRYNKIIIMGGDKNDYVVSDPSDFEAYDDYTGEDVGTMIYELDLDIIDQFTGESKAFTKPTPGRSEGVLAASATGAGITNAGQGGTDSIVAKSQGYDRRARSFSGGPEDFKTPNGSPDRIPKANTDKFVDVDVPSGTISGNESSEDVSFQKDVLAAASGESYHNGHASVLENYEQGIDLDKDRDTTPKLRQALSSYTEKDTNLRSSRAASVSSFNGQQAIDAKMSNIIKELNNEISELKTTAKAQSEISNKRVDTLQKELFNLKESHKSDSDGLQRQLDEKDGLIAELKSAIDPAVLDIESSQGSNSKASISELSKYKIERLELKNRLVYLEQENSTLTSKFNEFEPFMNNQMADLSNFQKIIKSQEGKIDKLTAQVKDQEVLHKEISDWKAKYESLDLEFQNYKTIHSEDEISEGDPRDIDHLSTGNESTTRSRREISSQLETLVGIWSTRNNDMSSRGVSDSNPEENLVVAQLQKQVDDLLRVSKESETTSSTEINNLKEDLNQRLHELRNLEDNYRDALQSVNNTSKALKLNESELRNQKILLDKLAKENYELKLFRRASKRTSKQVSPVVGEASEFETGVGEDEDDEEVFSNAHYNMKVKDLEADLYILKQERDQLKENVTVLQKQLYLASSQ